MAASAAVSGAPTMRPRMQRSFSNGSVRSSGSQASTSAQSRSSGSSWASAAVRTAGQRFQTTGKLLSGGMRRMRGPRRDCGACRAEAPPAEGARSATRDDDSGCEIPLEFTHKESPVEHVRKRTAACGRSREEPMLALSLANEARMLPDECWYIVLACADTIGVCRFSCTDRSSHLVALGFPGASFQEPGWLRDRRGSAKARWLRARDVLTQVKVVREMRSSSLASGNNSSGSAALRRCSRVQRLNRHRR